MRVTDYPLSAWVASYGIAAAPPPDIYVTHNAGLFSCCTIRLIFALLFYNERKRLPILDSSKQFAFYKDGRTGDLTPELFDAEARIVTIGKDTATMSEEPGEISFTDYSKLNFSDLNDFLKVYFSPSHRVGDNIYALTHKYSLDFENLCAVFYRGNDKIRETPEIPYSVFFDKAQEVLNDNPEVKFFLMPDESEFKTAFMARFPNTICFEETLTMPKKNSAIFYEIPPSEKPKHAVQFLSEVYIAAKCKHLITHSGNGGMWAVLFRGHAENMHQYLIDKWL